MKAADDAPAAADDQVTVTRLPVVPNPIQPLWAAPVAARLSMHRGLEDAVHGDFETPLACMQRQERGAAAVLPSRSARQP